MSEETDHSPPLGGPEDARVADDPDRPDRPERPDRPGPPDELEALGRRLRSLASRPLEEHPPVLDEVHRAVVAELDALAAGGRAPGR